MNKYVSPFQRHQDRLKSMRARLESKLAELQREIDTVAAKTSGEAIERTERMHQLRGAIVMVNWATETHKDDFPHCCDEMSVLLK